MTDPHQPQETPEEHKEESSNLDSQADSPSFLSQSRDLSMDPLPGMGPTPSEKLEGETFEFPDIEGLFIEAELGRGAHGHVYKAIDNTIKPPVAVAVKVLNTLASQRTDLRDRFDREIATYNSLKGANVIRPLSHGHITHGAYRGCPYLVMEFMDGGTFGKWMKDHPSKEQDALRASVEILVQVCHGLAELHDSGIVHRDLKPDNILLHEITANAGASTGGTGKSGPKYVKISDFGMVANLSESRDLSKTGMAVGTAAWMSPEQFLDAKNLTPISDQYAIGVMLYQLISLRRPWQSSAEEDEPNGVIEAKARSKTPCPPPSSGEKRVDSQLKEICVRCLEPDPKERYADVRQLRESLEAWLAGEIDPHTRSWLKRNWRTKVLHPVRRKPERAFMLILSLLLLVPYGFWTAYSYSVSARKAIEAKAIAEEETTSAKVMSFLRATPDAAGRIISAGDLRDPSVRSKLLGQLNDDSAELTSHERYRIRLGLLESDHSQLDDILHYAGTELSDAVQIDEWALIRKVIIFANVNIGGSVEEMLTSDAERIFGAYLLASQNTDRHFWQPFAADISEDFVSIPLLYIGEFSRGLAPINKVLIPHLHRIACEPQNRLSQRSVAASFIVLHDRENTDRLCDIALCGGDELRDIVFPVISSDSMRDKALSYLENLLGEEPDYFWPGSIDITKFEIPSGEVKMQIEAAGGMISDHFAYALELELSEAKTLCETLRHSGYRPVRLRPHHSEATHIVDRGSRQKINVSVVWVRDGGDFRVDTKISADAIPAFDPNRPDLMNHGWAKSNTDLMLQDLSAVSSKENEAEVFYIAVWSPENQVEKEIHEAELPIMNSPLPLEPGNPVAGLGNLLNKLTMKAAFRERRIAILDLPEKEFKNADTLLEIPNAGSRGFCNSLTVRINQKGVPRYTGIISTMSGGSSRHLEYSNSDNLAFPQFDISAAPAVYFDPIPAYEDVINRMWPSFPQAVREQPDMLRSYGECLYYTSDLESAFKVYTNLIDSGSSIPWDLAMRTLVLARMGESEEAAKSLQEYTRAIPEDASDLGLKVGLKILVAAWSGNYTDAENELQAAVKSHANRTHWFGRVAAVCCQAASNNDREAADRFANEAVFLLEQTVSESRDPYALNIPMDGFLIGLKGLKVFDDFLAKHFPNMSVAGVFRYDSQMESTRVIASRKSDLQLEAEPLIASGWRPVSVSVNAIENAQGSTSNQSQQQMWALLLQRPRPTAREQSELDRKKSLAVELMFDLGGSPAMWSYLTDAKAIATVAVLVNRFANNNTRISLLLDRLLHTPDTKEKTFLTLALGEMADVVPADDERRQQAIDGLLQLYRNDENAVTHSAARWALCKYSQRTLVEQIDYGLRGKQVPGRHWFVNSQKQLMVLVEKGEMLQGSPVSESGRNEKEHLHPVSISGDFWVGATEVTQSDWYDFVLSNRHLNGTREYQFLPEFEYRAIAPDSDCPVVGISWYEAASYCNWLSAQDGLPKSQWCYAGVSGEESDERLLLKSDYRELTGYRMPTEAEWEYACRGGTTTPFFFGHDESTMQHYGRCFFNSSARTGDVYEFKPNPYGIFGMLGNVSEFCNDGPNEYGFHPSIDPYLEVGSEVTWAMARGGNWSSPYSDCRAARRMNYFTRDASTRDTRLGFRIVKSAK